MHLDEPRVNYNEVYEQTALPKLKESIRLRQAQLRPLTDRAALSESGSRYLLIEPIATFEYLRTINEQETLDLSHEGAPRIIVDYRIVQGGGDQSDCRLEDFDRESAHQWQAWTDRYQGQQESSGGGKRKCLLQDPPHDKYVAFLEATKLLGIGGSVLVPLVAIGMIHATRSSRQGHISFR